MNLGEFHTLVSKAIGRSSAYDALIPTYTQGAARYIERNYSFQYMHRYAEFPINASATEPRLITLPDGMKKDKLIRIRRADGTYGKLDKIDPQDMGALLTEEPSGYFLSGDREIWLAQTPAENYTAEIFYVRYTTWPTNPSGTTWLLDNASDVLLAQTLIDMAPHLKDAGMMQLWGEVLTMKMKSLIDADTDLEFENKPAVMGYGSLNP